MQIGKGKFIACMVAAIMVGGAAATVISAAAGGQEKDNRYAKLNEIYEQINNSYYEDADEKALLDGACKGLVSGLGDPYSSYMTEEEYDSWFDGIKGEYSGIGVTFTKDVDGNYIVVSVTKGSPAERAGIQAGDIIINVNGEVYDDIETIANHIKGEEGTNVSVTFSRNGSEATKEMVRELIVEHSVEQRMLDDSTSYINITSFIDNTDDDFKKALEDSQKSGANKLVLDLRNNGGGLVDPCISVADEFLDEGPVFYIEDKAGNREAFNAKDGKTDMKTVVLVNENSASASEILAAALQDNGYTVVGVNTFGKGVIQSTVILDDGSALKLTVMQYFSPEGKAINKKGVTPDVTVQMKEGSEGDPQLDKAIELLK